MGTCPAVHPVTGVPCTLPEHPPGTAHVPPPEPEPAPPPAPEPAPEPPPAAGGRYQINQARAAAEKARLRAVDTAVEAGRRGKRDLNPPGTYPVRPRKPVVCAYGCPDPARQYLNGAFCAEHSPAALRQRAEAAAATTDTEQETTP